MNDKSTTVLVVEDEEILLHAITQKLEASDITAIGCSGGEAAIKMLNSLESVPNAIWLDYHLTDMNGLEFMGKLKENPKWADIPVIVVSNSAGGEKVHSMLALGAKQYLVKAEHRLDDIIKITQDFINEK